MASSRKEKMIHTLASVLATFLIATSARAGYTLTDDLGGSNFFNHVSFYTDRDPTAGTVQFMSPELAVQMSPPLIGYAKSSSNNQSVYLAADSSLVSSQGRHSVRVASNKAWDHGLVILDAAHMPSSTCGVWPAFWLLGSNGVPGSWPTQGGEIDIIEGVNRQTSNIVSAHTGPGCVLDNNTSLFTGTMTTSNCDVNAKGQSQNVGCSITAPEASLGNSSSYGTGFNAQGGGVYAARFEADGIQVHFFPRNAIPADIVNNTPDPSSWPKPLAAFGGPGCKFRRTFWNMSIILDTTFCGDWSGKVWNVGGSQSCAAITGAATCAEYVVNNPKAFTQAYWLINGLKVFQDTTTNSTGTQKRSAPLTTGRWLNATERIVSQPGKPLPPVTYASEATTLKPFYEMENSTVAKWPMWATMAGIVGVAAAMA
ncbi:hypothetical protein LTR50_002217 [Elasticomyces elasticus]|nr:hypothetical protein LTR50_002217 [Elasticomyces elasticus]